MRLPIVSVILPSYNCEEYISRAIESVLNQSFKDFELIIIDDGSSDKTKDIIESYKKDERVKPIILESNTGLCNALNVGIKSAKGKYYARLDQDDYWNLDKLQRQYDYMESNLETGACFTWVKVVDEDGNELNKGQSDRVTLFETQNKSRAEWLNHLFFKGSCLCHSSAFIRASVMDKVGLYNYSLRQVQDYELWMRIAKESDIHIITEPLMNYTWFMKSQDNMSAPSPIVMYRSRTEFLYCFETFFEDMSDKLFVEAFQERFMDKSSCNHEELLCEQAFLLLQTTFVGNDNKIVAIPKFIKLFQNDSTRNLLSNKYGFTVQMFYNITAYKLYADDPYGSLDPNDQVCHLPEDITFKALVKKKLKNKPRIFNVCKKVYKTFYK